jgi:flagellar protein FlaJ
MTETATPKATMRLWTEPPDLEKIKQERFFLTVGGIVFGAAALAFVLHTFTPIGDFIWKDDANVAFVVDLAFILLAGSLMPMGIWTSRKLKAQDAVEKAFPLLMSDLAENAKAGLTMVDSLMSAKRADFGALNPHVHQLAAQVKWGIPFTDAMQQLGKRCKSDFMLAMATLIGEAQANGGELKDVLDAAAKNARDMRLLEDERRANMAVYGSVAYVIYFVFVAVLVAMLVMFAPKLLEGAAAAAAAGGVGAATGSSLTLADLQKGYYALCISQSLGFGAVTGVFTWAKAKGGLLPAGILVTITWIIFRLAVL